MTRATGGQESALCDVTADVKRVIPARANAFNASRAATMEIDASIIVALVV